jgi:hypothetical protein
MATFAAPNAATIAQTKRIIFSFRINLRRITPMS